MIEMHAIFSGEVQGVFLRYNCLQWALELNIFGTIEDLPDGTVELYAQGSQENLEKLIEILKVRFNCSVKLDFKPAENLFDCFKVL